MGEPGHHDERSRGWRWPFAVLAGVSGLCAAVMMVTTTIDVAGRYLLNRPLHGAFEMTEIAMGLIVFTALPLAILNREMITVTVLSDRYAPPFRRAVESLGLLLGAILFGFMAWRLWAYGERLWTYRERTLELRVPTGLITQTMAALCALAALACLIAVLGSLRARARERVGGV